MEYDLHFVERNIFKNPLTKDELIKLLRLTENGTSDIISTRAKALQNIKVDLDSLSLSQLIALIHKYPSMIRRPIIENDRILQVGFNEDQIRRFLPRKVRRIELSQLEAKLALLA